MTAFSYKALQDDIDRLFATYFGGISDSTGFEADLMDRQKFLDHYARFHGSVMGANHLFGLTSKKFKNDEVLQETIWTMMHVISSEDIFREFIRNDVSNNLFHLRPELSTIRSHVEGRSKLLEELQEFVYQFPFMWVKPDRD